MSRLERLLRPETAERQLLELKLPPGRAMAACRGAIEDLGWTDVEASGDGRRLTGHEEPTQLRCRISPVRLEIELQPRAGEGATVAVEGSVPGVGPVASGHLRNRMKRFALNLASRVEAGP